MKEQNEWESSKKNFLLVDYATYKEGLSSILEREVKAFAVNSFGKGILDKIDVEITRYDEPDGEWLSIHLLFKEYEYFSQAHGKQLQCLSIYLLNNGIKAFYDDGKFFSKIQYEWISGSEFQSGLHEAHGLPTKDLYNKFNNYMLTC
ncbi:hypothetical protein [Desulfosporosinus sp.]|uniref:hypothetical protein n=1 Tax=Desulfosporosinus sp. TaxID=157907 RepID=UPI0025BBDA5B|nr:hypothetical protein [Desulfosporosinus sp.]MBC2727380.1 hypothetical protein [Desulfosporosinus sp.]